MLGFHFSPDVGALDGANKVCKHHEHGAGALSAFAVTTLPTYFSSSSPSAHPTPIPFLLKSPRQEEMSFSLISPMSYPPPTIVEQASLKSGCHSRRNILFAL